MSPTGFRPIDSPSGVAGATTVRTSQSTVHMWETQQMEDIEDGQWLTLAELADARHTSEASATRLVRRHTQWRRQSDNQGHVRVLVPTETLTAGRPGGHPGGCPAAGQ